MSYERKVEFILQARPISIKWLLLSQLSFLSYEAEENLLSTTVLYAGTCLFTKKSLMGLANFRKLFKIISINILGKLWSGSYLWLDTGKWLSSCLSDNCFCNNPVTFKVLKHNLVFLNWKGLLLLQGCIVYFASSQK